MLFRSNARFTTVYEAIGDLPALKCGERGEAVKQYRCEPLCDYQRNLRRGSAGVYNHESPALSKQNIERMAHIPPGE